MRGHINAAFTSALELGLDREHVADRGGELLPSSRKVTWIPNHGVEVICVEVRPLRLVLVVPYGLLTHVDDGAPKPLGEARLPIRD